MSKKRPEPRLFIEIDTAISVYGMPGMTTIREMLQECVSSPVGKWFEEAIPIEWLESKLTQLICSGKLKSSDAAVVYTMIHEWRKTYGKENEG